MVAEARWLSVRHLCMVRSLALKGRAFPIVPGVGTVAPAEQRFLDLTLPRDAARRVGRAEVVAARQTLVALLFTLFAKKRWWHYVAEYL